MRMVKICSDLRILINARDASWKVTSVGRVGITSSRVPEQQLQRRQSEYQQLGVQQALVLVQINESET